jgi:PleD family two-component response regulator
VEPLNALMRENRDSFFVITDDERIPIPFSAGCQVLEPGMDTHDLIKKADAAMYVTKSLRYQVP